MGASVCDRARGHPPALPTVARRHGREPAYNRAVLRPARGPSFDGCPDDANHAAGTCCPEPDPSACARERRYALVIGQRENGTVDAGFLESTEGVEGHRFRGTYFHEGG